MFINPATNEVINFLVINCLVIGIELSSLFTRSQFCSVGDDTGIKVMNQPWYGEWDVHRVRINRNRDITVAEIFDPTTDSSKEDTVRECPSEQPLQVILCSKSRNQALKPDRQIWSGSKCECTTQRQDINYWHNNKGNQ